MAIFTGSKEDIARHTERRDGHKQNARGALKKANEAKGRGDKKMEQYYRGVMFTYSRMAAETTLVAVGAIRIGVQEAQLAESGPGQDL